MTWSDGRRRGAALAVFLLVVVLSAAHIWLVRGIGDSPRLTYPIDLEAGDVLTTLAPAAVGLWVVWLRPTHPIGWLLLVCAVCLGLVTAGQVYGARGLVVPGSDLPAPALVLSLVSSLWVPAVFIPVTLLLVRYPSGVIRGAWARRFDRAALVSLVVLCLGYASHPTSVQDVVADELPPVRLPLPAAEILLVAGALVLLAATVCIVADALRRVTRGRLEERPALLLLLSAALLEVLAMFFSPWEWMAEVVWQLVLVSVAVGVLRYGALGIEVVVRRAVVYGALTGLVLLAFLASTAAVALGAPEGPLPTVVAAAVVAAALGPARDRMQRAVDRIVYGERGDPWTALGRLSDPGARGVSLLPDVLESLGGRLHLSWARVDDVTGRARATWSGSGQPDAAASEEQPAPSASVPLTLAGETLGVLHLGARRGQRTLAPPDLRLIEAVAPLIAAVLQAERVAEAVVTERDRFRQDLHDGLGPSLTGIGLGLEALQTRGADPELLSRLRHEVALALEETRRIIDDLRPTALDRHDLADALRHRAAQVSEAVSVQLDLPDPFPRLDPTVEKVAFRIVDEAITNVVRHAQASRCLVRVTVEDQVVVEISDDGVGLGQAASREDGIGLRSMQDRAARVGGRLRLESRDPGTRIVVDLPCATPRAIAPVEAGL